MTEATFAYRGAVPDARGEERTWFDHCREGRLMLQACPDCGATIFYPRSVCPECLSNGLQWVEADGRGTLHTFTVQHRAAPGFDDAPYIVAIVELREGVRMMSRLMAPPEAARIGMPVRAEFAGIADDVVVPVFVPDDDG